MKSQSLEKPFSDVELDQRAIAILRENEWGGYTLPTRGLYPYQWNWDSMFVALGFSEFDLERAWTEVETLFQGQWQNGMAAHIVFRRDDPSYFPGPSIWGIRAKPSHLWMLPAPGGRNCSARFVRKGS